ncbi:MAG: hypothetical protein ACRC42_02765 [Mycoplasma sp.]
MAITVKYQFSDNEIKKIEESYTNIKDKLPKHITNFNEYLNYFVETAIATHIQFLSINGSLTNMLDGNMDLSNINFDDIGDIMKDLFDEKSTTSSKEIKPKDTKTSKKN